MEQESTYLTLIESTKTYKVEGNKLKLMDNSGKVIFTFSKQ
jgi:heat shock protein HslJ